MVFIDGNLSYLAILEHLNSIFASFAHKILRGTESFTLWFDMSTAKRKQTYCFTYSLQLITMFVKATDKFVVVCT